MNASEIRQHVTDVGRIHERDFFTSETLTALARVQHAALQWAGLLEAVASSDWTLEEVRELLRPLDTEDLEIPDPPDMDNVVAVALWMAQTGQESLAGALGDLLCGPLRLVGGGLNAPIGLTVPCHHCAGSGVRPVGDLKVEAECGYCTTPESGPGGGLEWNPAYVPLSSGSAFIGMNVIWRRAREAANA